MKKTFLSLIAVLAVFALTAQNHVPASKSMVGIWRQTGMMSSSGQLVNVTTGNYKVINPDSTFYTFITWGSDGSNAPTEIGLYGTYKITSDSTCTEHIVKHATSPEMSGIDSSLKFKLVNENTLLVQWKNGDIWIKESWSRLQMGKSKSKLETPFI
jgi:hypothetical protein